jgi:hypothetical protein
MNTQKSIDDDSKKNPEQLKLDLFQVEEKIINLIIYCGWEGIEELVYASTSIEDTKRKLLELRTEADIVKVEASTYDTEEKQDALEESDMRKYADLFIHNKEADMYCVQSFKDGKFSCTCSEFGMAPNKQWLY